MKITTASFTTVILRFYLMMAIVLLAFFSGYPAFAVLAVPVFLSGLAGVSFKKEKPAGTATTKNINLSGQIQRSTAA